MNNSQLAWTSTIALVSIVAAITILGALGKMDSEALTTLFAGAIGAGTGASVGIHLTRPNGSDK